MNLVYVQSPCATEAQIKARQAVRENCARLRDVKLQEMSLQNFAEWYVDQAEDDDKGFDLHLVESSVESLDQDLSFERNYTGALMRRWEYWGRVVADQAMGAIYHAAFGMEIIVFICDPAEPTERIRRWMDSSGRLALKTPAEISGLDFLRTSAYRVESGQRAFRFGVLPTFRIPKCTLTKFRGLWWTSSRMLSATKDWPGFCTI